MKKRRLMFGICTGVALLIVIAVISVICIKKYYRVDQVFKEMTVELGDADAISTDIHSYIKGHENVIKNAKLNSDDVIIDKAGDYTVTCEVRNNKYNYTVHVVDSVAPSLSLNDISCLAVNESVSIDAFVADYNDASGEVECFFDIDGNETDEISFKDTGIKIITVVARDASMNETKEQIEVKYDERPYFMFLEDRTVIRNSDFDLMDYVVAYDNEEGIITDRIIIKNEDFDIESCGNYHVTYEITDHNGLNTSKSIDINVNDEFYNYNIDMSSKDIEFLDANEYFTYEALKENDFDKAVELTKKSAVDIYNDKIGYGSAFVYDITPDYIYFLTANHCKKILKSDMRLMFFNDETVEISNVPFIKCDKADMAMFVIPTNVVSSETLLLLKETRIDKNIYSDLEVGDTVYACTMNWKGGEKDINCQVAVKDINTSVYDGWDDLGYTVLVTENKARAGQSGSGVYDLRGNLVGVVQGTRRRVRADGNGYDVGKWHGIHVSIDYIEELLNRKDELVM